MVRVGDLLLGDQDGFVHRSVLLCGPVSGNPEVGGHAAEALARAGHFALLRGSKGGGGMLLLLQAEGPRLGFPPLWADSMWLLGLQQFRCSGRAGLALHLRATFKKSPRVAAYG